MANAGEYIGLSTQGLSEEVELDETLELQLEDLGEELEAELVLSS